MWAIHSGSSGQMSNCEQIAQFAHDKWVNVSDLLRLLMTNERMSKSLGFFIANSSFSLLLTKFEQFTQNFLNKIKFLYIFYSCLKSFLKKQKIRSFLLSEVSKLLRSLRTNDQPWAICSGCSEGMSNCEQIAQVAHQKRANEQIAHFLSELLICSLFWQKVSDLLQNSMRKFPTLIMDEWCLTVDWINPIL